MEEKVKAKQRPRIWIDTVSEGIYGVKITGALTGGTLMTGEIALVVPGHLSGTIRRIEVEGSAAGTALAGTTVSCELEGVNANQIKQGFALIRPNDWELANAATCSVKLLSGLSRQDLQNELQVAFGPGSHLIHLKPVGSQTILANEIAHAIMDFQHPLPLAVKDRFVLQRDGRTIGGGEIEEVTVSLATPRLEVPEDRDELDLDDEGEIIDLEKDAKTIKRGTKKEIKRESSLEI